MIKLDLSLSHYKNVSPFKTSDIFGDLELLAKLNPEIDLAKLAKLDQERRASGYLKEMLKGVPLTDFHSRLLALLIEEDAEYHAKRKKPVSMKGIEVHGLRYRIKTKGGSKVSFDNLDEAIKYRDRKS